MKKVRMIDAEAWIEELNQVINDPNEIAPAKQMAVGLIAMISERPTACDLDKIVDQIEYKAFDYYSQSEFAVDLGDVRAIISRRGLEEEKVGAIDGK